MHETPAARAADLTSDSMKTSLYQVDAFSDYVFGGNPAAVCRLETWLPDKLLQKISQENHLSETAFYVIENDGFKLRWFTPAAEVDLCGHATLATAYVLFELENYNEPEIRFHTRSGILTVKKSVEGYTMNFPCDEIHETETTHLLRQALGVKPVRTVKGKNILMAELESEKAVKELQPEIWTLMQVHAHGVIVTAQGSNCDFVSRCFFPNLGINEDPVTGSAHTLLTPYWSAKLGKTHLRARQISARGGELICDLKDNRVDITGKAVLYLRGQIEF